MKAEKIPASPSSDEATSQKQDPLERRRLQNRLSQRNHRRKIRDRIAKLQERVIANELRAAAALNGWDQQFTPSPLAPAFHRDHDHDMGFLKGSSVTTTDPKIPFMPSFNLSPAFSWSRDVTVPLSPTFMSGDSPCFPDASAGLSDITPSTISASNLQSQIGIHPSMDSMFDTNIFQGISSTRSSLFSERPNTTGNQPLCYTATEATLPHIIQVLSNMSPQSKIIVLLPPDSTPASTAAYPSPAPTLNGVGEVGMLSSTQRSSLNGECPCQAQNGHGALGSKYWMAPGSQQPGYSSHKDFNMDLG